MLANKELIKTKEDVLRHLNDKTEFEKQVLVKTFMIPIGKVSTYKRIAEKINKPYAYRAVGNALHKNPLAPVVPCHRVIRSDGKFGGDKKGAESRRNLLKKEGIPLEKGRVKLRDDILF